MTRKRTTQATATPAPAAAAGKRTPIIVVLGMHRSGSSAITRGLMALGVSLGDNLMPPAEGDNDKGYWEDLDIYQFNEKVLNKAGSAWHKLGKIDKGLFIGPALSDERREGAALLSRKIEGDQVFAFKDPRTAVLLPLWKCIFEDLDLDDRYLITVRNPLAAAASLKARDCSPLEKGIMLWAKHMLEAVRGAAGRPRVFVSYDNILADPLAELRRIAAALDLPAPDETSEAVKSYETEFLTRSLRHNIVGDKELERSGLANELVQDLYQVVSEWADADSPGGPGPDPEWWRSIESRYAEAAPLLAYADGVEDRCRQFEAKSHEVAAALNHSEAEKQSLAAARASLENDLQTLKDDVEQLRRSNAAEIGVLTQEKAKAEEDLGAVRAALKSGEAEKQSLAAARASLEQDLQKLAGELEQLRRSNAAEIGVLTQEKAKAEEELGAVRAALKSGEAEKQSLAAARASLEQDLQKLAGELEQLRRAHAAEIGVLTEEKAKSEQKIRTETDDALSEMRARMETATETFAAAANALVKERDEARAKADDLTAEMRAAAANALTREQSLAAAQASLKRDFEALTRQAAADRDRFLETIDEAERRARQQKDEAEHLRRSLAAARDEVELYRTSTSWKLTAPVRMVSRLVRPRGAGGRRSMMAGLASALWRKSAARDIQNAKYRPAGEPPPEPLAAEAPRRAAVAPGRMAAPLVATIGDAKTPAKTDDRLAVVLHAYYEEFVPEILERLGRAGCALKLYVTTPAEKRASVERLLAASPIASTVISAPNRGRDIGPFLSGLAEALRDGRPYVLKLHTKKSPQLAAGQAWREDLFDSLLAAGAPARAVAAFEADPSLGIIGPDGHLLRVEDFIGANRPALTDLAKRLGLDPARIGEAGFVGGSMFYARASIWSPLLAIGLSADDFEAENGQTDGALAHAIERLVGLLAESQGLRLASLGAVAQAADLRRAGEYRFV